MRQLYVTVVFLTLLFSCPIQENLLAEEFKINIAETLNEFSTLDNAENKKRFTLLEEKFKQEEPPSMNLAALYGLHRVYGDGDEDYFRVSVDLLNQIIRAHPDSSDAYALLGFTHVNEMGIGRLFKSWDKPEDIVLRNKAITLFQKSLELNSANEIAYMGLSQITESDDEEIDLLKKTVAINPKLNNVWGELAQKLAINNRYDEAVKVYLLWQSNSPADRDLVEIFVGLGNVFFSKREYSSALSWYEKAVEKKSIMGDAETYDSFMPSTALPMIYYSIAKIYMEIEEWTKSESFFKKALALQPDRVEIRFDLGRLYLQIRRFEQAISEYEQVLSYEEGEENALYNLALAYKGINDLENSRKFFLRYLEAEIDKEGLDSQIWIDRAKAELRAMGIYDFPKSSKELKDNRKETMVVWTMCIALGVFIIGGLVLVIKFKRAGRAIVLAIGAITTAAICIVEANSLAPKTLTGVAWRYTSSSHNQFDSLFST